MAAKSETHISSGPVSAVRKVRPPSVPTRMDWPPTTMRRPSILKDEAVARQLDWSVRTMRRRISRLYELLGAANRFQAGAIAVRKGWI